MTAKDRVQKHRANLKEQCYGRLEISMSMALIDQLRKMARLKGMPVWSAVQEALEPHLTEYQQLLAEGRRLRDEWARVMKLEGNPEFRSQGLEYNRQLADYNTRLSRFQEGPSPT